MEATKTKGVFGPIETKADAAKFARDAGRVFFVLGLVWAGLAMFAGRAMLINAALFLLLGGALWRWKSRTAAMLLLFIAAVNLAETVLNELQVENVIFPIAVLMIALKAAEAAIKFHRLPETTASVERTD